MAEAPDSGSQTGGEQQCRLRRVQRLDHGYRFFNNPLVTPEQILQPHREATQRRWREHPVALIVQDTTEMEFTRHPPNDAQGLNTPDRYGLNEHVLLAVTPKKLTQRGVNCNLRCDNFRQSN